MSAHDVAIVAAGVFFLNALLTGVWKYRGMARSPDGLAHPYIDTAHRASLLYSFAAILLTQFIVISELPDSVELGATLVLVAYFAIAISAYMVQGLKAETDNVMREVTPALSAFMWSLIVAEIGAFLVLFYGVLSSVLTGTA